MTFETILTPETIDEYTAAGYWSNRTITDFLDEAVARTPDKTAAIDSRRQITYRELQAEDGPLRTGSARARRPSGRCRVVPAAELDRVPRPALRGHPDRCGQQPADPDLPGPRGRLHGRVRRIQGAGGPAGVPQVRLPGDGGPAPPDWPALQHVFVVDGQPGDANPSWESFMDTPWEQRRDPAELAALRPDPNEVTLLMFTSGTTGEPKGVMHTHNTLVAAIPPLPERLGVNSDSVIHMASTVRAPHRHALRGAAAHPGGSDRASTRMCGTTSGSSN